MTNLEVYWYIIGGTIGSGLFVLLPYAIGYTGRSAVLACLVAAAVTLLAQIYNIIIAGFFPLKGGDYSQVAFLTPPLVNGLYGLIWIITCLTMSAFATSAVSYLGYIVPGITNYTKPIAVLILTFFFVLNYFGAKFGAKFEGTMTVLLLASLALFVIIGLPKVNFSTYFTDGNFFMGGFAGFSSAVAMCMWACQGPAITAIGLASEMDNPTRRVPGLIIKGMAIVAVVYMFIIFVACGVLPIEEVAWQELTVVANAIFPGWLYVLFIIFGAVFALLSSLMSSVTVFRYPFEQLAEEGWLPPVFKKRAKNGWPYVGMIAMYIIGLIPILFNISFDTVVAYTSIPGYIIIIYVNLKCMILPKQYPEQWKRSPLHMPMPLYYGLCILGTGCTCYAVYCYLADQTILDIIIAFGLAVIFLLYAWFCLKTKKVDKAYLEQQKADITAEILEYEKQQEAMETAP